MSDKVVHEYFNHSGRTISNCISKVFSSVIGIANDNIKRIDLNDVFDQIN